MTWAEWVDSAYNTGGFSYNNPYDNITDISNYIVGVVICDYSIKGNTTITNNGTYTLFNPGACD